jgi:superfamily II DNA helicase RecQ
MLPTLVETGMTTVLVVPLVALTGDMKRRCNQAKIRWTEWKGTVHTAQNLYYVVHD